MTSSDWVQLIVILVGGGGLISGIVAALKFRGETAQIVVNAAQGAVVVQSGVIDELKEEVADLRREVVALKRAKKVADDQVAVFRAEAQREADRADAAEARVGLLLRANEELRENLDDLERRFDEHFPNDPP